MPKWASRIELEIVSVRPERVQAITEADALASGMLFHDGHGVGHSGYRHDRNFGYVQGTARGAYATGWNAIHGPGSCERNEWVWVLEVKRWEKP